VKKIIYYILVPLFIGLILTFKGCNAHASDILVTDKKVIYGVYTSSGTSTHDAGRINIKGDDYMIYGAVPGKYSFQTPPKALPDDIKPLKYKLTAGGTDYILSKEVIKSTTAKVIE